MSFGRGQSYFNVDEPSGAGVVGGVIAFLIGHGLPLTDALTKQALIDSGKLPFNADDRAYFQYFANFTIRSSAYVDTFESRFIGERTFTNYFDAQDLRGAGESDAAWLERVKRRYDPTNIYPPLRLLTINDIVLGAPIQSLSWPRTGATAYGDVLPDNIIPEAVCLAVARTTLRIIDGQDPFGDWFADTHEASNRQLIEQSVGPITQKWQIVGEANAGVSSFTVEDILRPLFGSEQITVGR